MKTITFIVIVLFLGAAVSAQTPQSFRYQAVAHDNSGNILANQSISFRISILSGSVSGTIAYSEIHTGLSTNVFGLVELEIGKGTPLTGIFSSIEWGNNLYFVKVEMDPNGGTAYQTLSTSQLLSVPYALHSKTVEELPDNSVTSSKIASMDATSGQVLKWDGATWTPNDVLTAGEATWNKSGSNIYYNSGNVGIGSSASKALLHVSGTSTGEGNVLFTGTYKSSNPGDLPTTGAGTRLMWYPDKAAFRVGSVSDTNWNKDSIGFYSVAMGFDTKAKGYISTAMGFATNASGPYSFAVGNGAVARGSYSVSIGQSTNALAEYSTAMGNMSITRGGYSIAIGDVAIASGNHSTAIGNHTAASGNYSVAIGAYNAALGYSSTAIGFATTASGDYSTAMGLYTTAQSWCETVIGSFNTNYTSNSVTEWKSDDRLFVIGNGTGNAARSNAITVLKNGNVGLGTDYPSQKFHIKESAPGNAVLFIEPNKWEAAGDYGEIRFGDTNHYIRGEHTKGMTFNDANKFNFSGGNVGIGIDNPAAKLDVSAPAGPNLIIRDSNGSNDRPGIQFVNNNIHFIGGDDSGDEIFGFYSQYGNNRTYAARLNIHGPATNNWGKYLGFTHDGNNGRIDTDAGYLILQPAGQRVGIGTNSPTQALHVVGNAYKTEGGTSWATSSDLRLKTVLGKYEKGLDEIAALQSVRFVYNAGNPRQLNAGVEQVGFVAQEVQKIFPEAVNEAEDGYLDFNIHAINIALVNAVQRLKTENERLKAENELLIKNDSQQNARLEKLELLLGVAAEK